MSRVKISLTKAKTLLAKGKTIHTFQGMGHILLGADLDKKEVFELIKQHGVDLSGPNMLKVSHGLVTKNKEGKYLFLETREGVL